MKVPLVHVDAFTDRPFAGNAALVCLLHEPREAAWMQVFAQETHLPATVFLWPHETSII